MSRIPADRHFVRYRVTVHRIERAHLAADGRRLRKQGRRRKSQSGGKQRRIFHRQRSVGGLRCAAVSKATPLYAAPQVRQSGHIGPSINLLVRLSS